VITEAHSALVLVVVGTDHHRFDRLVSWVDDWYGGVADSSIRCLIQYGTSVPPVHANGVEYVGHADLDDLMAQAHVVVSHGGPSTIVEACRRGHLPLVVPRSAERGEHVDGHQERFALFAAGHNMARVISSRAELAAALAESLRGPARAHDAQLADPTIAAKRLGELVDRVVARTHHRRAMSHRTR
jgi:UDP-N-acetylglucosamine transferase subunit ALG13